MSLFKYIKLYFDLEKQRTEMSASLYRMMGEKGALEASNRDLVLEKNKLTDELAAKTADVSRLEKNILLTPYQLDALNAKIDELNRDLRAVADANKIVEAAHAIRRFASGEKV